MKSNLVSKYNIPAPRYTSYPTVPYWDNNCTETAWMDRVKVSFVENNKEGISLYIHLPFCESLCTYCACNTRITVNHRVEVPYIQTLLKEWDLYLALFNEKPLLKEIHLGGGTPTFFSPQHLEHLIRSILDSCIVPDDNDFSFEGHPANTSREHLQVLFDLGFRRVSFGVQDFDEKVQDTINRYQTFDEVKSVIEMARAIGYTSVNIDLVYGLPFQTRETVIETIEKIVSLEPERIAFYSYAHVPWIKPGQRKYSDKDLPVDKVKRDLYEVGKAIFLRAGYLDIGMDHFALKEDELFVAFNMGKLHRNFMGYTNNNTRLLIGLGCSSISDTWDAFCQNIKTVEEYQEKVNEGHFPIAKGHLLTEEDQLIRGHILNLMCRHESDFNATVPDHLLLKVTKPRLKELVNDELITIVDDKVILSEEGRLFLRNICMAFDRRYWSREPVKNIFSTTA